MLLEATDVVSFEPNAEDAASRLGSHRDGQIICNVNSSYQSVRLILHIVNLSQCSLHDLASAIISMILSIVRITDL